MRKHTPKSTDDPADDAMEQDSAAPRDALPHEENEATHDVNAAAPGGSVEDELAELRGQLSSLNERHLRLAAEFDNYRKRTDRERQELEARSQARLASVLLDAVDDMKRVAALDGDSASTESLLEGFRLVERKLDQALSSAGLERIEAEGQRFDPEIMEALMTVPAESEAEEDVVADVLQPGYRFGGHLLRPARVRVKKLDG